MERYYLYHKWPVYQSCDSENEVLLSSNFGPDNQVWYLMIIKQGEKDGVYLVLYRVPDKGKIKVKGTIEICSNDRKILDECLNWGRSYIKVPLRYNYIHQIFINASVECYASKESSVQTDIVIRTSRDSDKLYAVCNIGSDINAFCSLSRDIQTLYEKREQADFLLECNSVQIRAHKFILSARSPVFSSIFRHDTKENIENKMVITDVNVGVMEELIFFLYTNRIHEMTLSMARDLYCAADKYSVLDLKALCQRFLLLSISSYTVFEMLLFADLHQDEELKKVSNNYIFLNFRDMKNTEEWKTFTKEHSFLAIEVLTSIAENFIN
ncbi:speckle-type POZ protein-like [Stegodyphus dumicola]|uniref:speckle-type POZ protein-like n=1 Tax=Stegodyphus dumicola TaxID=202533 RepID=UPI0015A8E7D3|nr:speckle-type POZ protein-like [Stegodyphus dumicola]